MLVIDEMQELNYIKNSINRTEHFANSLLWYANSLKNDIVFQKNFNIFLEYIILCDKKAQIKRQLCFIAIGKSAKIAELLVAMLISVGICARFIHPTEACHGDLGIVDSQDFIIFISNNGNSNELLELLPHLAAAKITCLAITSKLDSPLAKACNYILQIPPFSELCPLNNAPLTSTITTLALGQLLVAASIEARNFSLSEYANNHPGGAIGKRIFLKIDELMLKGSNLPYIAQNTSFKEMISAFTKFAKAALLVIEDKKFIGLVTEKDLRLAMEKHDKNVFDLKAKDIMNTKAVTILPGILAIDAKDFMLRHKPPLNVLPVIDQDNEAIGMLRLLDLIDAKL